MTDSNPGCWPDASKPGEPANPERTAPHWFRTPEGHDVIVWRHCEATSMWWDRPVQEMGFTYIAPCHTPAEVAALVEAARREGAAKEREACAKIVDCGCETWDCLLDERAAAIRARGDA